MRKSLYMNNEVARIENGEYFIIDNGWEVLKRCTKEEMIDFLNEAENAFMETWNKETTKNYIDFKKEVSKVRRRYLKSWVVNILVGINFFLIMLMSAEVEDMKLFVLSKLIMLVIFVLISLVLGKYSRIFEEEEEM